MWTEHILEEAETEIALLLSVLASGKSIATDSVISGVISALADDLDTPKALSLINNWAKQSINCDVVSDTEEFLKVLDALLGLKF